MLYFLFNLTSMFCYLFTHAQLFSFPFLNVLCLFLCLSRMFFVACYVCLSVYAHCLVCLSSCLCPLLGMSVYLYMSIAWYVCLAAYVHCLECLSICLCPYPGMSIYLTSYLSSYKVVSKVKSCIRIENFYIFSFAARGPFYPFYSKQMVIPLFESQWRRV